MFMDTELIQHIMQARQRVEFQPMEPSPSLGYMQSLQDTTMLLVSVLMFF